MRTVQRLWQRLLVGTLLLAALAPAFDATSAEVSPKPKEKAQSAKQSRVFRLKHVKPEEVRQALEGLLGPPGNTGPRATYSNGLGTHSDDCYRLTVDERTQSIVMRGLSLQLQWAASLIAVLDPPDGKPMPKLKNLQVFKLKYARADTMGHILKELDIDGIRILSLMQTNRLLISGPDAAIKEVAELIEQLDVESKDGARASPPAGLTR